MELSDGAVVHGEQRILPGRSAGDGGGLLFPALPEGVTTFTLAFGDFMIPERGPAEVSFAIPDVDREQDRVEVPLDIEFMLAEDRQRITKFVISNVEAPDGRPGGFEIHLESPMPPSPTNVRIGVLSIHELVVVDDLGNTYGPPSAGVEVNRDEHGMMIPAGVTGLVFDGRLSPAVTELTLKIDYYDRVVRGGEPLTIELPGE